MRRLTGVGVLAAVLARTASGLGVIGRRDAATTPRSLDSGTRKRDREVPFLETRGHRDPLADDPSGERPSPGSCINTVNERLPPAAGE